MQIERVSIILSKLEFLHNAEEILRVKADGIVEANENLQLHLAVVKCAMDLADMFRQFETNDENLKVVKILGMRTFNGLASSLKLALSGYSQNSVLILRDVLETVFLLELFQRDRALIERWRFADKKDRMKEFSPVKVRTSLDALDGFKTRKRAELYGLFSELASHPTMKSAWMMRPEKDGDAVIGPFIEASTLEAVLSEMGRLAIQVGAVLYDFCPTDWKQVHSVREKFTQAQKAWLKAFYPNVPRA